MNIKLTIDVDISKLNKKELVKYCLRLKILLEKMIKNQS